MKQRRITAITGTRADYDLLYPLLKRLEESDDYALTLVATGAHLSREFGSTIKTVKRDGWTRLVEFPSLLAWDTPLGRVTSLSTQLAAMARVIEQEQTELILVLGDREEPLVGAICGTYLNIPVAHVFGGDSGYATPDDQVRHAVTQMADLHFTATTRSRDQVVALGAAPARVAVTGNPGLDRIAMTPQLDETAVEKAVGARLDAEPYLIVTFHPLDREHTAAAAQMETVLRAVGATGWPVLVNSPNSDAGSHGVRTAIAAAVERASTNGGKLHAFTNLPRNIYVNLLRGAACMVGNSSSGILEAPFLRLPAVNVGERQVGREHTGNVRFTACTAPEITAAVKQAVADKQHPGYGDAWWRHFGDGTAAQRMQAVLDDVDLRDLDRNEQSSRRHDGS